MKGKPPVWIEKLLSRFLTHKQREAILGDLEEKFFRRLSNREPIWKVKIKYVVEGIGFLKMMRLKNNSNSIIIHDMFRNNIKLAWRSFLKQRATSFINVFCLTVAIAFSIPVYLFVHIELDNEYFHRNGSTVFLVESQFLKDDHLTTTGRSPKPLGPAMQQELPLITDVVRVERTNGEINLGDGKKFYQWVHYVDPGFMNMFTFPLKAGHADALSSPQTVILSDFAARNYFGNDDPIGRTFEIKTGDETKLFTVGGVTDQYPTNTSLRFFILAPYGDQPSHASAHDWKQFTTATFIKVSHASDVDQLKQQMNRFVVLHNATVTDHPMESFTFDNLYDLKRHAANVEEGLAYPPFWIAIIMMTAIATLLLLLAGFNFMNISFASAIARFKEIGVRKVVGISRFELFTQFMTETLLTGIISVAFGALLVWVVILPLMQSNGVRINDVTDFMSRPDIWFYCLSVLMGIAFLSGAYPAFVVSCFRPVVILRGRVKLESKNRFMQSLLVFQFALAFITMITCLTLFSNAFDEKDRFWGYDPSDMVSFVVKTNDQLNALMKEVSERPDITSVSVNASHVGFSYSRSTVEGEGRSNGVVTYRVSDTYFKQLDLRLKQGKFPKEPGFAVVNETFVKSFDLKDPIGKTFTMDSVYYVIQAVVEDFHYFDFQSQIDPVVMEIKNNVESGIVVVKTTPGRAENVSEAIGAVTRHQFPNERFFIHVQDKLFDDQYRSSKYIVHLFIFTTFLALFMSGLALFGLASQRMANRLKEICIRKIFGVPVFKAVMMVNGSFLYMLIIAAVISTPASYVIANILLDSIYAYHSHVNITAFLTAYVLMFVTLFITLSGKMYKVATVNPSEILRSE